MTIPLPNLPPLLFDAPWLLLLVIVLPLLVWWLRRQRQVHRTQRLARYASMAALTRLMVSQDAEATRRTVRLMAVGALLGVALAGPRWGLARGPMSSRGIDMAIAIDASLSMLAQDERPSRLERVKQEVRRLRAMSPADRVALIAFAGRSYILTPLTADDGAIELFLDNLDPSVVGQAGSALSRAIRQGSELLMASDGDADRALVLLSDGESFDSVEDIESAASEAGSKGISVVTVGFGTLNGATIPVRDGSVVQEKRDDEGQIVVTRYSPELSGRPPRRATARSFPPRPPTKPRAFAEHCARCVRRVARSTPVKITWRVSCGSWCRLSYCWPGTPGGSCGAVGRGAVVPRFPASSWPVFWGRARRRPIPRRSLPKAMCRRRCVRIARWWPKGIPPCRRPTISAPRSSPWTRYPRPRSAWRRCVVAPMERSAFGRASTPASPRSSSAGNPATRKGSNDWPTLARPIVPCSPIDRGMPMRSGTTNSRSGKLRHRVGEVEAAVVVAETTSRTNSSNRRGRAAWIRSRPKHC